MPPVIWGFAALTGAILGVLWKQGDSAVAAANEQATKEVISGVAAGEGGMPGGVPPDVLKALGLIPPTGGYYGDSAVPSGESFSSGGEASASSAAAGDAFRRAGLTGVGGVDLLGNPVPDWSGFSGETGSPSNPARVTPSGSTFEGALPTYTATPAPPPPTYIPSGQGGRFVLE